MYNTESINEILKQKGCSIKEYGRDVYYIHYEIYDNGKFFSTIAVEINYFNYGAAFVAGYIIGRI